ncbi:MAG: RNA polymerase sigma factor [Oscillospiraceae bacterium]|nr:RNA polymerase sigma factor [Oscillospiraceae bacterium]
MEDRQIVALYWERNPAAIDRTAEKYGSYCTTVARNILQNREDAEECVNDTWLCAWNSIPPNRPENLATFLGRLTRNRAIDRLRSRNSLKRGQGATPLALEELSTVIPAVAGPESELLLEELVQSVNRFLGTLSQKERDVFLCRYWYFDSVAEIGADFGFSESKVKTLLYRTRKKLRQALQKEGLL